MKISTYNINTEQPEYEIDGNYISNVEFGNWIMSTKELLAFEFPVEFSSETFILQLGTIDYDTYDITWANAETLNNTYRNNGYFESYEFPTELKPGIYRILIGSNYASFNLFDLKSISGSDSFTTVEEFLFDDGEAFEVDTGENFVLNL